MVRIFLGSYPPDKDLEASLLNSLILSGFTHAVKQNFVSRELESVLKLEIALGLL
jgi:hypothetical protein